MNLTGAAFLHLFRLPLLFVFLPQASQASEAAVAPGIPASTYLQATIALMLILGLLFGATWAARKVSGGRLFGQGNMRVISGIAIGPKERIVLVEVEDTWLVIGVVPGQIRTLHTLPKGINLNQAATLGSPGNRSFAEWLKNVREGRQDNA